MAFGARSSLPAPLPAGPGGAPAALGGTFAVPAEVRLEQSLRSYGEATERAQMFARKRSVEVSEQLLASLARKHDLPENKLKELLDRARKGDGWVPKADAKDTPVTFTPEEALAYFYIEQTAPKTTPLVVREYAAPRPGADDVSFQARDTVLWQPVIVVPSDGKAKVQFHLGDAPGGYQVVVAGHTLDGRIGAVRGIVPVTPPQLTTPSAPPAQPAPVPPPAP